jgi:hypothetical protein
MIDNERINIYFLIFPIFLSIRIYFETRIFFRELCVHWNNVITQCLNEY